MKIHEYQAKAILARHGVPVPRGEVATNAADAGARKMQLTVIEQRESLIAWYERRGYRATGAVKAFPYDDARVGAPKRADLRLAVFEKAL